MGRNAIATVMLNQVQDDGFIVMTALDQGQAPTAALLRAAKLLRSFCSLGGITAMQ
jgi:hypothetical protein